MAEVQKKPRIWYADGCVATFLDVMPTKRTIDKIGEDCQKFYLRPTPFTKMRWKISEKDRNYINTGDYAGTYECIYKADWCIPLSQSPKSPVWFLLTDYKETKLINILNDKILPLWNKKIDNYKTQLAGSRALNASLTYEIIKISKNPALYMKKNAERLKTLLDTVAPQYLLKEGGGESGEGQE